MPEARNLLSRSTSEHPPSSNPRSCIGVRIAYPDRRDEFDPDLPARLDPFGALG
jgi:hypothetical protein